MNLTVIPKKNTPFPFQVTRGCLEDVCSPSNAEILSPIFHLCLLPLKSQGTEKSNVPIWQSASFRGLAVYGSATCNLQPLALHSIWANLPRIQSKSQNCHGVLRRRSKRSCFSPFVCPIILILAKGNSYQFNILLRNRHLMLLKGTCLDQFNSWLALGIF